MWNTPAIDDLTRYPLGAKLAGYAINIRPELMQDDLLPYVVEPATPKRTFAGDAPIAPPILLDDPRKPGAVDVMAMMEQAPVYQTVFLVFPNQAAARRTSLGQYWVAAQ